MIYLITLFTATPPAVWIVVGTVALVTVGWAHWARGRHSDRIIRRRLARDDLEPTDYGA